jgi:hypothetical protein
MKKENKTIKVNLKDENEWIEKVKVAPTTRINLEDLDISEEKQKE